MAYKLDPTKPAVQQIMAMHQDIVGRWLQTHTMADVEAMKEQIKKNQEIRRRLFGMPRPVERTEETSR